MRKSVVCNLAYSISNLSLQDPVIEDYSSQMRFPTYRSDRFYVAVLSGRWGGAAFNHFVEYTIFKPNTAANSLFNCYCVRWQDLTYYIAEVPLEYQETLKKMARVIGMKICDGIPTYLSGGVNPEYFPLSGDNVWTLENRERPYDHITPYISEVQETQNIIEGKGPIIFN